MDPPLMANSRLGGGPGRDGLTPVIGLSAGGHAKVVIDILRLCGGYDLVGLLDPKAELWGSTVEGVPILGDDRLLGELVERGVRHAFVGVGSVGDPRPRQRLYQIACEEGLQLVSAIHPSAVVARSAVVGRGATVMAGAIVNPAARLGNNVIINTGAIVEHDCVIGDHSHVATGAHLAGSVQVGPGALIGLGASVRQGIRVGSGAVVGTGAAVVAHVADREVVAGVPARSLKRARRSNS